MNSARLYSAVIYSTVRGRNISVLLLFLLQDFGEERTIILQKRLQSLDIIESHFLALVSAFVASAMAVLTCQRIKIVHEGTAA